MKKFTKVCLITALIFFIIGCIFCVSFGTVFGGFRQLNYSVRSSVLNFRGLKNFIMRTLDIGDYYDDDWYDDDIYDDLYDLDDLDDWDEEEWSEMNSIVSPADATKTNYRASDIRELDIELGGENLIIEQSEDDYIRISNNSGNSSIKYGLDGGTFKLHGYTKLKFLRKTNISHGSIYLYLPAGISLDSIDLEVGAGKLESIALAANEINIDTGAGNFNIEGVKAQEVEISVGAGNSNINSVEAGEADISVGAGSISVNSLDVREISLEVGLGNIYVEGTVTGSADVECGMGNISMILNGRETDYNYNLECAMGTIRIGSSKYSGIANEKVIDNGSIACFDVECSMGNIDIEFK